MCIAFLLENLSTSNPNMYSLSEASTLQRTEQNFVLSSSVFRSTIASLRSAINWLGLIQFFQYHSILYVYISSSSNFTASLKGCLASYLVINKTSSLNGLHFWSSTWSTYLQLYKIFTCCVLLPQYLTRASRSVREQKLRTKVQKYQTCRVKGPCVLISLREDIFS